jgi:hypothetical protein
LFSSSQFSQFHKSFESICETATFFVLAFISVYLFLCLFVYLFFSNFLAGVWLDAAPPPRRRRRRTDSPINQLHELERGDAEDDAARAVRLQADDPAAQAAALAAASNAHAAGPALELSNYFVVANSEFKLKLWQYDVSQIQTVAPPEEPKSDDGSGGGDDTNTGLAKEPVPPTIVPAVPRCVRTALGPTFGAPVRLLLPVPRVARHGDDDDDDEDEDDENDGRTTKFLAYSTGTKVRFVLWPSCDNTSCVLRILLPCSF